MKFLINKPYTASIRLLLLVFLLCSMGGCKSDFDTKNSTDNRYIKLELGAPSDLSSNYLGNLSAELKINSVTALVFLDNETFAYKAETSQLEFDNNTGRYSMNILLRESAGSEQYSVSILANIEDNVGNMRQMEGADKAKVLSSFAFKQKQPIDLENATIPMYGETAYQSITAKTQFVKPIKMLRALAKVDFFFDKKEVPAGSASDFKGEGVPYSLSNVYLYNTPEKGRVTPDITTKVNWSSYMPTEPSLYTRGQNDVELLSLKYGDYNGAKSTLTKSIYLTENNGGSVIDREGVTIFVVGITKDNLANAPIRYYRVNIASDNGSSDVNELIRNNYYKVLIGEVSGNGSDTPEEARDSGDFVEVSLSIKEWETADRDLNLVVNERFHIGERVTFLYDDKVKEVPFTTDIYDRIFLNWGNPDYAARDITNGYYNVVAIKNPSTNEGTLRITALKSSEELPYDSNVPNKYTIHAGNMRIQMEIIQKKATSDVNRGLNIECVPTGYYIKDKYIDNPEKNYLDIYIPEKQTGVGYQNNKRREVTVDKGDVILIEKVTKNGISFESLSKEVDFQDIVLRETENGLQRFIHLKVPAKGKPIKVEQTTFNISYRISKARGDVKGVIGNVVINTLATEPDSQITPKVLVVGHDYNFNLDILQSNEARYYNTNIARLLINPANFGDTGRVKVESFLYQIGSKYVLRNLTHVESLKSLGAPDRLDDYNIIIYINSAVKDELLQTNSIYVEHLTKMVKDKKVVLIQLPSRESPLDKKESQYVDNMLSSLSGSKFIVYQSKANTQTHFVVSPSKKLSDNSPNSTIVYFPRRDSPSLLPVNNSFANFRDYSYLEGSVSYFDIIATTKNSNNPSTFPKDQNVILRSSKFFYLWLGSSFVFSDESLVVDGTWNNSSPKEIKVLAKYGLTTGYPVDTNSSEFFIDIMKWAVQQLKEVDKNK